MHDSNGASQQLARLDKLDAALINRLQEDLPLLPRPFAAIAAELGYSEDVVIERLQRLLAQGTLTRFGPLFQIERAGGLFVLAAMQVPEQRFEAVAMLVNALPEVAHNYRREHALNMWFVIAVETPAQADSVCARIEALTDCTVLAFPKEREFFVGLKLPAQANLPCGAAHGLESS
ncbi:AsnC family transcriptional regulator [Paucibacter sp. TC2R-5]|uniref:Lrp/AsnC family transcriptional regulator n=1 Tax=Paucibacter sp. TC2R-5 TaxID=2893555 RepID=UPI0021E3A696|nr:AsnC family transcriptional regulator [Paucibacter sp. TC2R-5]MCV2358855.1 AsnC family transcriptional regulator [Paucibacter sp. TC2R-5]